MLTPTILAVMCGVFALPRLNTFYRLLLVQVILYLAVDAYAANHNDKSTVMIYNISMPLEVGLLLTMVHTYFFSWKSMLASFLSFLIFLIIYSAEMYYLMHLEKPVFAVYAAIAEGLIFTFTFIYILYAEFMDTRAFKINFPLVLAISGMLLYFAATIPCLSIIEYLGAIDPKANKNLFISTIGILGQVRYLLIAVAFFLIGYQNRLYPFKQNAV